MLLCYNLSYTALSDDLASLYMSEYARGCGHKFLCERAAIKMYCSELLLPTLTDSFPLLFMHRLKASKEQLCFYLEPIWLMARYYALDNKPRSAKIVLRDL